MGNATSDNSPRSSLGAENAAMIDIEKVKKHGSPIVASRYHLESERPIASDYDVKRQVLGSGLGGDVVIAHSRIDGTSHALKSLRKQGLKKDRLQHLIAEVEIHLTLDHPNVAHVHDVYESETAIALVTEHCKGGELYDCLQNNGVYSEAAAAEVSRQILRAVHYLHSQNIVHRDLKLDNFLYKDDDPHRIMSEYLNAMSYMKTCGEKSGGRLSVNPPQLKLIDFGFATYWTPGTPMTQPCGSPMYISPDIIQQAGYTNKCDLWSIGVIVWMLLAGHAPFLGEGPKLLNRIKAGHPEWRKSRRWSNVSEDALDFLKHLMMKDCSKRMDAHQALQHPWLTIHGLTIDHAMYSNCSLASFQLYASYCKMRRAALQLLVRQINTKELQELSNLFVRMDASSNGWIATEEISKVLQATKSNEDDLPVDLLSVLGTHCGHRVYYTDFLAATIEVSDCGNIHRDALRSLFARLDADGSNSIGVSDLHVAFGPQFEGVDVSELIREARPEGGEILFEDFVRVIETGDASMREPVFVHHRWRPSRNISAL